MIPDNWIQEAQSRIDPHIHKTPLRFDASQGTFLKWENQQITGSFKVRGALNKVLTLLPWERQQGLVAASAGNHGMGVALAGKLVETSATIFASEHAVPAKVEAMLALGADVQLVPGGYGEAEEAGIAYASSLGKTWISPYNDGQIIAGQGTLGLEILEELPSLEQSTWVIPAGGGGLVSGIGAAIKANAQGRDSQHRQIIAVQSEASPFLHNIYHQGTQDSAVELPSIADGLAGRIESNSITIPLVRHFVDDFILVSEEDISQAIAFAWKNYKEIIEGSAASTLAAILSGKIPNRPAIVIISGGNIQPEIHAEIITGVYE